MVDYVVCGEVSSLISFLKKTNLPAKSVFRFAMVHRSNNVSIEWRLRQG